MVSIVQLRKEFREGEAERLALQVDSEAKIQQVTRRWTNRAVRFQTSTRIIAVVGCHEGKHADEVLSHGLFHAADQGRALVLLLPIEYAEPTRRRLPWITADVSLWTHDQTGSVRRAPRISQQAAIKSAGGVDKSPTLHLNAVASERVRGLSDWATGQPELISTHRRDVRAWSYRGQRVLTIKGNATTVITAGVDAKSQPARSWSITGPLDDQTLSDIQRTVTRGMTAAHKGQFGAFAEHRLQHLLRRSPNVLRLDDPLLREVPAWRPASGTKSLGRGFIDLVGLDSVGDLVLVETKLGNDPMLALQGLDYWVWAQHEENRHWLVGRLNVGHQHTRTRLLFAIGAQHPQTPAIDRYTRTLLAALDSSISWQVALVTGWQTDDGPLVAELLSERQTP